MIFVDSKGNLTRAKNSNEKHLHALLEDLRLIKGENPLKAETGIDYLAVFRGEAFFKVELQNVLDLHEQNFASIEVTKTSLKGDVLSVDLLVAFKDGTNTAETISVEAK